MADDETNLPEGAIPLTKVEVSSYLNPEGQEVYRVRCNGGSLSSALGLLEMAKADIMANSNWRPGNP